MIKFAITGNIASGKSQVEKYLSQYYPVYDTDNFAHEILNSIDSFYELDVFTNGIIDRKKLGNIVFKNPEIRKKLENIIHPKVKVKINEIFELHKNASAVFVSVPLLFEAGFESMFDKIIFVSCPVEIRLKRLMERNTLTEKDALLRINAQNDETEKIKKSNIILYNDRNIDLLYKQIENEILKLL